MLTLYKFLDSEDRSPANNSSWKLGRRRSLRDGQIIPCERGFHAAPIHSVAAFVNARLYRVEIGGEHVWHGRGTPHEKLAAQKMRLVERIEAWDDRAARLFAADCAERVVPLYESRARGDDRPRRAIETARRYAEELASDEEMGAAARAARAASVDLFAWACASFAALAAAEAAASGAAWAVVWSAAWSARAAVRSAARSADEPAANDAAKAAERQWQARHLAELLGLPWDVEEDRDGK